MYITCCGRVQDHIVWKHLETFWNLCVCGNILSDPFPSRISSYFCIASSRVSSYDEETLDEAMQKYESDGRNPGRGDGCHLRVGRTRLTPKLAPPHTERDRREWTTELSARPAQSRLDDSAGPDGVVRPERVTARRVTPDARVVSPFVFV